MTCGVYEILNIKNGRRYIGSSVNIERRWKRHLQDLNAGYHHSTVLQRAWGKNGRDAFQFNIVMRCSQNELLEQEQNFINALAPIYNIVRTAGRTYGLRHTPETRKKMSASRMGHVISQATRFKISEANKGKSRNMGHSVSAATRLKISQSLKGHSVNAKARQKISDANRGNHKHLGYHCTMSVEIRQRLSETQKARYQADPEAHRKMVALGKKSGVVRRRKAKVSKP